jgi:hypothetical protein
MFGEMTSIGISRRVALAGVSGIGSIFGVALVFHAFSGTE